MGKIEVQKAKHIQLKEILIDEISKNIYPFGAKLPSVQGLIRRYAVSDTTVLKALTSLEHEGYIRREKGRGTFVTTPKPKKTIPSIGFFYLHESEVDMARVAEYVQRCCARRKTDLKAVSFDWDYYDTVDLHHEIEARELTGAIFVTLNTEGCRKSLHALEKSGFPYVRFNLYFMDELTAPIVRGDDIGKVRTVMDYLWHKGHRRIGLVYRRPELDEFKEYINFYQANGGYDEKWLMQVNFSGPPDRWHGFSGQGMAEDYLERNSDVTAIVTENAAVCMDLMWCAERMGKELPQDLSFVCLWDWPGLSAFTPPVTAARQPRRTVAERTCEILFDIIEKKDAHAGRIEAVPLEFIERGSVFDLNDDR